jgi:hypothetical protein
MKKNFVLNFYFFHSKINFISQKVKKASEKNFLLLNLQ